VKQSGTGEHHTAKKSECVRVPYWSWTGDYRQRGGKESKKGKPAIRRNLPSGPEAVQAGEEKGLVSATVPPKTRKAAALPK